MIAPGEIAHLDGALTKENRERESGLISNVIEGSGDTSNIIIPAPSPMTKPSRSLLNGLEALDGVSLDVVVRLRDRSKPEIASG